VAQHEQLDVFHVQAAAATNKRSEQRPHGEIEEREGHAADPPSPRPTQGDTNFGALHAVDVTPTSSGAELDAASERLFRPMSWEPWHVQLRTREAPPAEEEEVADVEPPSADLKESGLTVDDVDDAVAVYLESLEASRGAPPEGGDVHAD